MLTKGAIGNLIRRYRAVLKKCRLLNVLGPLAAAGVLLAAFADVSFAEGSLENETRSFTEDTTINADKQIYDKRRTGIIAQNNMPQVMTVTVASGKTLAVISRADSSDNSVSGAVSDGDAGKASLAISGNVTFSLEAGDKDGTIFIADGNENKMSLDGTISGSAVSESGRITGTDTKSGGQLSVSGDKFAISLESKSDQVTGIQIAESSSNTFASDSTVVSVKTASEANASATYGVRNDQAAVSFTGNTEITVTAGRGVTYGLYIDCQSGDESSSVISFSGKSTVIDVTGTQETYAAKLSGGKGSISFSGEKADIKASSVEGKAYGIDVSYEGHLSATADVAVTVQAAGEAYGAALREWGQGSDNYYAGNADFDGSLTVSATSATADAYGVYNSTANVGEGNTKDGKLNVAGDSAISATATKGDAFGIYTAGEYAENRLEGNTKIQASAPEGKSYGVLARKAASLSIGGDGTSTTITATGAESTAVALEDSSALSVTGTTALDADKALDGTGAFSNSGDLKVVRGTVDTFTGSYTQTSGSTALPDDSNFFGGDVTIKKGSLTVGDIDTSAAAGADSVLGLGRSIEVQTGKNLLIGTDSGTGVVFGSGSALVLDGNAASLQAMIRGSGTLTVEDGSRLYITNAKSNTSYFLTEGLDIDDNAIWTEATLQTNRFIQARLSRDGSSFLVTTEVRDIASALPGVIPVSALTTMFVKGLNDTASASMGIRFLSRATEPLYISDDAKAVATINEVSRAAVTAGVQNTSLRLADAAADTVLKHLSLASFDAENNIHKDGIDVWATPMYGNTYTHDMSTSVCGNYGGLAIGADVHLGTFAGGNLRAGIAVNGGGGHSETRDNATSTDNSYNFGGVSLYGGWTLDNLNIMASLGYNAGRHEIEMSLPSSLGMGTAEADVYTRAFTADLRAEYLFRTDFLNIMPHAGVRYTALYTDDYDLEVNGSRLNSVESDMQNIVQFPVGVTFSRDIAASGWIVKPQVDLAVVPAVGELRTVSEVSWAGINATDDVSTRVMDTVSYTGRAGIQAEMGNFAIGLNYGIQAAWHETNHSLNAGFTWKF